MTRTDTRRLVYSDATGTDPYESFVQVHEDCGLFTARMRAVFDRTNDDENDEAETTVHATTLLNGLVTARLGESIRVDGPHERSYLELRGSTMRVGSSLGFAIDREIDSNSLFLDAFSVVENAEPRKREARDVTIGPVEQVLLDVVRQSPDVLLEFSPRAYEVLLGSFLAAAGFYNVKLSRFVRDGGYDLFAVACDGDTSFSVVVEVKHYSRKKVVLKSVDLLPKQLADAAPSGHASEISRFELDHKLQ